MDNKGVFIITIHLRQLGFQAIVDRIAHGRVVCSDLCVASKDMLLKAHRLALDIHIGIGNQLDQIFGVGLVFAHTAILVFDQIVPGRQCKLNWRGAICLFSIDSLVQIGTDNFVELIYLFSLVIQFA